MLPLIIGAAVSIGSAIVKHNAQNKASKANEKSARSAARMNSAELTRRGVQEAIAAAAQVASIRRQTITARASIAASAAAGGLAGNTIDALDAEAVLGQDEAIDSTMQSLVWAEDSLNYQKVAEYQQMKSRIASVPRPSMLGTALQIGSGFLDAATQMGAMRPPVDAQLPGASSSFLPIGVPGLPGLPLIPPRKN